jgi:hypothetical protein
VRSALGAEAAAALRSRAAGAPWEASARVRVPRAFKRPARTFGGGGGGGGAHAYSELSQVGFPESGEVRRHCWNAHRVSLSRRSHSVVDLKSHVKPIAFV